MLEAGIDTNIKDILGHTALVSTEYMLTSKTITDVDKIAKLKTISILKDFEKPTQQLDDCRFPS